MLEISQSDNIRTVALARSPVNTVSPDWIEQFSKALEDLRNARAVSVVHIRSAQQVFSAGFDLTPFRPISTIRMAPTP